MNKYLIMGSVIFLCCLQPAAAQTLCPDGTYVGGSECHLSPDGTYVGGEPHLAPDGSCVGGEPSLAPDGGYVGSKPQSATDDSYFRHKPESDGLSLKDRTGILQNGIFWAR